MVAATGSSADSAYNKCGIPNRRAYSILSAFNMTDASGKINSVYLFRNPWGLDNNYNQSWNATYPNWTNALVAQVPLGVDPRKSQGSDGVFVLKMELLYTCFADYYIGHIKDS